MTGEKIVSIKQHPVANPSVVLHEEFDDWAVLFDPETGDALGINPAGVLIWKCLAKNRTMEDIAGQLKEICSDVPETILDEVKEFIDKLAAAGFVGYEVAENYTSTI